MEINTETAIVQVFHGPGDLLTCEERPLPPELNPGEVLVAIDLATICGSDLHSYFGNRQVVTPSILGHEAVGHIVRKGDGREDLEIGQRITWSIADSCGHCQPCTNFNLPQKCDSLFKYGHASTDDGSGLNGCFATHILLRPGTHVVPVPDSLIDSVVAPANCALATMVNAVSKIPENTRSVMIQGAGLLGLYGCALLKEKGIENIFCVDIHDNRLALVFEFEGIPIDGRPESYDAACQSIMQTTGHGVDVVIEVAGDSSLVQQGVEILRPGGTYILAGMVHPHSQLDLRGEQIIRKCLNFIGIHNYAPHHLDGAVRFLEDTKFKYPYRSLVSPPVALQLLEDAFHSAQAHRWPRISVKVRT